MKDGPLNLCRVCKKATDSAAYAKRQATLGKTAKPLPAFPAAPPGHKYCRHCKQLKPHTAFTPTKKYRDGYQSWCRTCVAQRNLVTYHAKDPTTRGVTQWANYHPQEASAARARRRKFRPDLTNAAHRRWIARYPEKHATHHAVYRALTKGLLTRPTTCEQCGMPCKPAAHHDDYSQPLVVRWLCPRCHSRADRQRLRRLR
jgi:ribosomal protein S27AE